MEYLCSIISLDSMTVSLAQKKKDSIKKLCLNILTDKLPIIPKVPQLLAKFTGSFPAVQYVHYRALESDKIMYLKIAKGNFSKEISISSLAKSAVLWWV